jgi:hypothetical protein
MYKRLLLGILLSYTTIFHCSSSRNEMQTPPIARIISQHNQIQTPLEGRMPEQQDEFDHSLTESSHLESLSPAKNNPSNHSGSPAPTNSSFFSSARNSADPAVKSVSPARPNSTENTNDEGWSARPNTPVDTLDEELLKTHLAFTAACLRKFNNNLNKAAKWEEEKRKNLANNNAIRYNMQTPDSDANCARFAEELMRQKDLSERCGIGNSPTYVPEKNGQHRPTAVIKWVELKK